MGERDRVLERLRRLIVGCCSGIVKERERERERERGVLCESVNVKG